MMFESPTEKAAKAKALKKLMTQWMAMQGTERKAALLLAKNPGIKPSRKKPSSSAPQ
jgi:hypothetical protein